MEKIFTLKSLLTILISLVLIIIILSIAYISGVLSRLPPDIAQYAQLGDFFGGMLNPIFAFFTFILLFITITLQSKELEATREELEKSRIAQEEQSNSLELQNIATKQQIFENTFFKLIELFNENTKNIEYDNKQRYANIFRAQLSKDELEFLFFHCLSSIGRRKFKPLVEKYEFFEHITVDTDIQPLLREYNISAFGNHNSIVKYFKS